VAAGHKRKPLEETVEVVDDSCVETINIDRRFTRRYLKA
jgi:hypothetical protein